MKLGCIFGLTSGLLWGLSGTIYNAMISAFSFSDSFNATIGTLWAIELLILLVLSVIFLIRKEDFHFSQHKKAYLLCILSGIIAAPVGMSAYLLAIQYLGISYTASISSSYILIAAFLSHHILKEPLSQHSKIILFSALSAVILASVFFEQATISWFGVICALVCAVSWAVEVVLSAYSMNAIASQHAYFFREIGALLGYSLILTNIQTSWQALPDFWAILPYLAVIIFSSMFSYLCYYRAIALIQSTKAVLTNITYSIWALIFTYIFLGNVPNNFEMVLCGIIFVTALLVLTQREQQ